MPPLQPGQKLLSLTTVVYREGDLVGKALAFASLLPLMILVGYITCIGLRRDTHTVFILVGQLLNEAINAALKSSIKEERPDGAPADSYGMPSSHSQFMAFFAVYVVSFLAARLRVGAAAHMPADRWAAFKTENYLGGVAILIGTLLVMASRVYLKYHTPSQVAVGLVIGAVLPPPPFPTQLTLSSPPLARSSCSPMPTAPQSTPARSFCPRPTGRGVRPSAIRAARRCLARPGGC